MICIGEKYHRRSKKNFIRTIGVSVCTFMVAMAVMIGTSTRVLAANKAYQVEVLFDQSGARGMLELVNDFRTGDNAWAWDANGQKVYYDRGPLSYDYNLEQIAMQRAVEQIMRWGHDRPDGSSCFSLVYNGTKSMGENVAMNWTTVEDAFIQFLEEDEDYSGQGHRRAMLGAGWNNYTHIGIAHVVYNGWHYYVQEFATKGSGAAYSAPVDTTQVRQIVADSDSLALSATLRSSSRRLEFDATAELPDLKVLLKEASSSWGGMQVPLTDVKLTWTSKDTSVVKVVNGKLQGVAPGKTTVEVQVVLDGMTATDSLDVEVTQGKIRAEDVGEIPDQKYTGNPIEPPMTVTRNGRVLKAGTDYEVSYSYNTRPGTAYAVISGIGNYTGSCRKSFVINKKEITDLTILVEDATYCGSALEPEVVVMDGERVLESSEYRVSYSNNVNVGEALVTVSAAMGTGYEGETGISFNIHPADLGEDNVVSAFNVFATTYNGQEAKPVPMIQAFGKTLTKDVDFTLMYANNVNAGMAMVTAVGKGNFCGQYSGEFEIYPLSLEEIATIGEIPDQVYYGEPVEPEITVSLTDGSVLVSGQDYTVYYESNEAVGYGYAFAQGIGNYTSEISRGFRIGAAPTPTPGTDPILTGAPKPTVTPVPGVSVTPVPMPTGAPGVSPTPYPGIPGMPTPTMTPVPGHEPSIAGFVERLYTIALNRKAEPEGKAFWVNEINSGNRTGGECAHFFLIDAEEFLNRGLSTEDFVETLYKTFFDRASEPSGKAYWVGELKSGRKSREDVINGFIDSTEWCNICATYGVKSGAPSAKAEIASRNATRFATRLYTCCLGRSPEPGGLKYWSLALTNLEQTGCSAAKLFFTSEEFVGFKLRDEEYVRRLYTTFMDRVPSDPEVAYWVSEIAKKTQTRESILAYFGSSEEFTAICKTYGIERGTM